MFSAAAAAAAAAWRQLYGDSGQSSDGQLHDGK